MSLIHLPKQQEARVQLIQNLEKKLKQLKNDAKQQNNDNENSINSDQQQILTLRLKLIQSCTSDLSIDRITHLQQIFKHYCTHIFKIGKHMTFQRLEYERVHLTLDRFFIFLRDFGLVTQFFHIEHDQEAEDIKKQEKSQIKQKQKKEYQIIQKNEVIRIFKRVSQNCRDLSFEGFISCLEKLAILYYDNKQTFVEKLKQKQKERQERIKQYRAKMKKKLLEAKKQRERREKKMQNSEVKHEANEFEEQKQENNLQKEQKQENDDLIQNMMKDQNIQNPNEEVVKAVNNETPSLIKKTKSKQKMAADSKQREPQFILSSEQKIQYYYQLIGVDNVHDFRKRMSQLNLPMFKPPKKSSSTKIKNQIEVITFQESDKEQNMRLIELRQKLSQKKQKQKNLYSPMTQQQYAQRKKRRQEKQDVNLDQSQLEKAKPKVPRKIDLSDKQLNWDFVNQLQYQNLKVKFDYKKFINIDEQEDKLYLKQYESVHSKKIDKKAIERPKRTNSNIGVQNTSKTFSKIEGRNRRNGSEIISDFKKRAKQIQRHESNREAKLTKFVGSLKKQQKKYSQNGINFQS